MRLIHTPTLVLQDFIGDDVPPYAILSHRWGDEEVSLQEFKNINDGQDAQAVKSKAGYEKIASFCREALKEKLNFGWVDTCCIDKTSSAELSEAINSMFRWYANSQICYAYLSDVSSPDLYSIESLSLRFQRSQWFTRGWTLQELIAPREMSFHSTDWTCLGSKKDLAESISTTTGIPVELLRHERTLERYSIACRMSWSSRRKTTRVEDLAYCLMGVFNVNMPMLYGEGKRAFVRLQEEILRSSTDQSIFAWKLPAGIASSYAHGLLADAPSCFRDSGEYHPLAGLGPDMSLITLTNNGISLKMPILANKDNFRAVLNCCNQSRPQTRPCVQLTCNNRQELSFSRIDVCRLEEVETNACRQQIYVRQQWASQHTPNSREQTQTFRISVKREGEFARLMTFYSCWVSPHCYLEKSDSEIQVPTTRACWTQTTLPLPVPRVPRNENTIDEVVNSIFTLPQFPGRPAVLAESSRGPILFGRFEDGSIGVREAPERMLELIKQGNVNVEEAFLADPKSYMRDEDHGPLYLKLRDGSELLIDIKRDRSGRCDFCISLVVTSRAIRRESLYLTKR